MTGLRATLLALLAAAVAASAAPLAGEGPDVSAIFDHAVHRPALEKTGVTCAACHGVGQPLPADGREATALAAPLGTCHACHVDGAARKVRAPSTCGTCHPVVDPPPDHGLGWIEVHGAASRGARCDDCHRGAFCVDCHERREPVRYAVHDRAFLGIHGIEVRTDPGACGSCHVDAFCIACHATGGVP